MLKENNIKNTTACVGKYKNSVKDDHWVGIILYSYVRCREFRVDLLTKEQYLEESGNTRMYAQSLDNLYEKCHFSQILFI